MTELRLFQKQLRLRLLWWNGFSDGAEAIFRKYLAKRLHLVINIHRKSKMTILSLSFSPLFFSFYFYLPFQKSSLLIHTSSSSVPSSGSNARPRAEPPATTCFFLPSCILLRHTSTGCCCRPTPAVPCRGTVSWRCSDLAARASGSACREESARRRAARKRRAKTLREMEPPPEPRGAVIFGSVPSLLLQSPGFPGLHRWSRSRN